MKVLNVKDLPASRKVDFHAGVSNRILLASDGMGFTLTKTVIQPGVRAFQHYKNHHEACYCVSGKALLENATTGEYWSIYPGMCYVLDEHDPHYFEALEETVLICVFNPPLVGREVHGPDGSYAPGGVSVADLLQGSSLALTGY